jgi:transcriptional regulator with XRE-family HTH domain
VIEPNFAQDLAGRLASISSQVGGHGVAARLCGVSLSQYKRYVAGRNQPTFETVVRLALAANVSLEWLATGRGRSNRSTLDGALNEAALSHVLAALDDSMAGRGTPLSPNRRAAVAATAYAMVIEEGGPDSTHVGRVVDRLVSLATTAN